MSAQTHDVSPRLRHLTASMPLDGAVGIELEDGVPVFRASGPVQTRIETLIEKQKDSALTGSEEDELDSYAEMDDYLSHLNRVVRNQHRL